MQSKNKYKQLFIAILSTITISSFPPLFLYFQNSGESKFKEIILPLFIFNGVGIILFALFWVIIRDIYKASVIASITNFIFLNFNLIEKAFQKIFSILYYWHIVLILLFVLLHLVWIVWKKLSHELTYTMTLVILFVFAGLIFLNGIMATPTIIKKISLEKQRIQEKINETNNSEKDLPNIYFLIIDEYSSNSFMEKYFNYDNSKFTGYLERVGFNISYTSHNESIMTSTVATNLVNLDYVVNNDMPEAEKAYYRKNNFLFRYLKEKGYKITGVGNTKPYDLENVLSGTSHESSTLEGETLSDLLFKKTILWPFYISPTYTNAERVIISSFQYLKNADNFIGRANFTFSHFVCPHEPFYFNKFGKTYDKPSTSWKNLEYYLGQYIFVTNQIMEIVESIVENDPNSIIIIQSDHSARAASDDDLFLNIFSLEDMYSVFNAVYCKGEKLDIEGLSGVNTLRLLFNRVFGEKFDMLEVPPDNYKYK